MGVRVGAATARGPHTPSQPNHQTPGQGQDGVRFEAKLLSKLGYLTRGLSGGDFRPTDQETEVQGILHGQLGEVVGAVDALIAGELAEFNGFLEGKGVPVIRE